MPFYSTSSTVSRFKCTYQLIVIRNKTSTSLEIDQLILDVWTDCNKILWSSPGWQEEKWLNFGGDPVHDPVLVEICTVLWKTFRGGMSIMKLIYSEERIECSIKSNNALSSLTLRLPGPSAGVSGSLDSYCSLKPLCSGMGEVVPARTSPTLLPPSPRTVLSLSCFKVSQCINCRDWHCKG